MKREIEKGLTEAALGYFEIGMSNFHIVRNIAYFNFQTSLGNLSISIELMLKSIIAKKAFKFLYTDLPLELEIKLTYPESTNNNPILKIEEMGMQYFNFNTQSLDKCISIFYILYPSRKQELKPYFNFFSSIRNISVHGAIPAFQKYDLERIAYLAINIYNILKEEKLMGFQSHKLINKDEDFFNKYDSNRVERVRKAFEDAKVKAKKVDYWSSFDLNEWDFLVKSCPVCNCDGTLTGSTELQTQNDIEGDTMWLEFYADSFKCEECGLELLDATELRLANMDNYYERDGDTDKWLHEKGWI